MWTGSSPDRAGHRRGRGFVRELVDTENGFWPILVVFFFDTSATLFPSDRAQSVFGGPSNRGGSFIVASIFDQWHSEHPSWRVIENASGQRGNRPIIQAPEVTIGEDTVGPVWFEQQPDKGFRQKLVPLMDRPVEVKGVLGGLLFQYFRVTMDYPGKRAYFRKFD